MKGIVVPVALLILASTMSAGCMFRGSPNYEAENNELIATLPLFPGASETGRITSAYTLGDSGPEDGYGTRVTFRVPAGTSPDDVVGFYSNTLADWRATTERIPGGSDCEVVNARFRKGNHLIALGTENLTIDDLSQLSFDLYVDARATRRD